MAQAPSCAPKPCLGRQRQVEGLRAGRSEHHVLARGVRAALRGGQQHDVQRRVGRRQAHGELGVVQARVARVQQPVRAEL